MTAIPGVGWRPSATGAVETILGTATAARFHEADVFSASRLLRVRNLRIVYFVALAWVGLVVGRLGNNKSAADSICS